ncbi:MAG: Hsp70 family protein, partial [Acidobacteriota bacterium]
MSATIFGIDLGTTNSCLAVMRDGVPRVLPIDDQPTVPSVVSLDPKSGQFVVGVRARNRRALYPELTVSSIKRRMGEGMPVAIGNRHLLPEEVSAEILRYLKSEGSKAGGEEVSRVVITVPAYFEDAQRRATIRAGELAGLEVMRIINEPTAASLVYERVDQREVDAAVAGARVAPGGREADGRRHLLVYDLGGGTFDVSLVRVAGELYEVCASCGDTHLGGDDFDQLLLGHLLARIAEGKGADLRGDRRAMARLRDAAERAKIELSSRPYTRVMEEALAKGVDLDLEVARDELLELIDEHLERTLLEVDRALHEARLRAADIDRVLLVGGSTRIPRVLDLLEGKLGRPVTHSLDPDLCVALGAAVQGAIIGGSAFDRILIDVAAHSLGIKTLALPDSSLWSLDEANHFSAIIPRNTQIPVTRSEVFGTLVDNQDLVNVEVYQGEHELCSKNTLIGEFDFKLLPAPAHSPVVVELSYDLEGIIHVVVSQKETENRREVTLSSRRHAPAEAPSVAAGAVDNFILRKARRLAAALPDAALRERLSAATTAYELALKNESAELDRREDELLELL